MIVINETTLSIIIVIIVIFLVIAIIKAIFRFIKWILSFIWGLLTGKRRKRNPADSDYWLDRAQARQEIRFQNAMPPTLQETKKRRKTRKERKAEEQERKALEAEKERAKAAENAKFANNPNWKWDEKAQLWRHVGTAQQAEKATEELK